MSETCLVLKDILVHWLCRKKKLILNLRYFKKECVNFKLEQREYFMIVGLSFMLFLFCLMCVNAWENSVPTGTGLVDKKQGTMPTNMCEKHMPTSAYTENMKIIYKSFTVK